MFMNFRSVALVTVFAVSGISGVSAQQASTVNDVLASCPESVSCSTAITQFIGVNDQAALAQLSASLGEAALVPGVTLEQCQSYANAIGTVAGGITDADQREATFAVSAALCTENFQTASITPASGN